MSWRAGLLLVAFAGAACATVSTAPPRLDPPQLEPPPRTLPLEVATRAPGAADQATQEGPRRSGSLPAKDYVRRPVRGFDVRVAPGLLEAGEAGLGAQALDALERDLGDVLDQTPPARHAFLQSVPIFLGVADPVAPCACYHPSARWLERNGFDPAKAKAVEITSARTFLDWRRHQPSMVLHELSHGLYDQQLRSERRRLETALGDIRERGVYDRTLRWSGAEDRHYALNNIDEYFAETTEALYGVNDFYPFVRAELLEADPRGAALVQSLWEEQPLDPQDDRATTEAERAVEFLIAAVDAAADGATRSRSVPRLDELLADDFELVTGEGSAIPRGAALTQAWPAGAVHGGPAAGITARRLGSRHLLVRFEFGASGATCSGVAERVRAVPGGLRWLALQLSQAEGGD